MKTTTNLYTFKNYAIIASVLLVVPLAYAATQTSPILASFTATASTSDATTPEAELTFGIEEKARKGTIDSIDKSANSFTLKIGEKLITIQNNASTTFYVGTGEVTAFNQLDENTSVYVFGYVRSDDAAISATKIVLANKSKLARLR